ncbi:MAG: YgjV family protein [Clostridia bacterium]|nr:YgjV family protein [Clostridia bacterium]
MNFIFSQLLGIIVSLSVVISMQLKDIKKILICQLICNGMGALSYVLLDGFSGCGIYIVALLQSIVMYLYRRQKLDLPKWVILVFVIAFLCCSIITFNKSSDIISAIAALTCALGIAQEKPSKYRMFMLFNGIIWMIYDVLVGAYTMMLSHVITVISSLAGILRLDLKRKEESL